jgi:multicomponent Na+:H+ antiporter subunit G
VIVDLIREWLGGLLVLGGGAFMIIGAIGLNRMPDLFTRMHAASVSDTLGFGMIMLGLMVISGFNLVTVKLLFLILFIALTGPVATHALARAARQANVEPVLAPDGELPARVEGKGASPSKR